jgi:hypothetical protein
MNIVEKQLDLQAVMQDLHGDHDTRTLENQTNVQVMTLEEITWHGPETRLREVKAQAEHGSCRRIGAAVGTSW